MEQKKLEISIEDIFIKILLKNGKKSIAEKLFQNILILLKKKTKQKPNFILIKTIQNLSPKLKLISVPVGKKKKKNSKNRYFLMFLNEEKQIKISIIWLLSFSKSKNFIQNISNEILETFNKKSKSIEKKKQMYTEIKKLKYNIKF